MKTLRGISVVHVFFVIMLLIPARSAQGATAAWETNTDRPGMDYKNFWIDKDIEAFVELHRQKIKEG